MGRLSLLLVSGLLSYILFIIFDWVSRRYRNGNN